MDLMLRDKPVLITGAAGTLGLATAKCFLEEGALVAITDLQGKENDPAVVSLLSQHPKRVIFVPLDLSSNVSIANAVEGIQSAFGDIHSIVHNAASFHFSPMREWPDNGPLDRHYV